MPTLDKGRSFLIASAGYHDSPTKLFDPVRLKADIDLGNGTHAPAGTLVSVGEVWHQEAAELVECFRDWVKSAEAGNLAPANQAEPAVWLETLGVGTASPYQLQLVIPAAGRVGRWACGLLEDVKDFAEFIQQRTPKTAQTGDSRSPRIPHRN